VTVDGMNFAIRREIALEIRRVDNDVGQMAGRPSGGGMKGEMMSAADHAQLDNCPILMPGLPTSFGLPPVPHILTYGV